ncbi:HAMP domain-containing sensor histidine kinase [Deinococcus sp. YIM 134068]|uniref:sensor histidine kinase n=1 Tax=Deinococcus lichenicola TaxID=3118910 RepID=UPI002F9213A0
MIAALAGLLLTRRLLAPLRELGRGVRALGSGEPPPTLPPGPPDELGELTAAFNAMGAELERRRQADRRLTADIAHDLNTPLTVMRSTLEGLLDGTFPTTPERLARLHTQTLHLGRLVGDLRLLALAETGDLHLRREGLEAGALVGDVVAGFAGLAEREGVTLTARLPDRPLSLHGDPTRLTQVLGNLITNALTHTPAGGRVEAGATAEPGHVVLTVRDTGRGIPAASLPHVFERAYRADAARAGTGTGLGLSSARTLVEAHGGRIDLTSEEGRGTTARVVLPAAGA